MHQPEEILREIRRITEEILGGSLVGIYVHGSLAFGCFTWEKSDIDYLVVIRAPMTQAQKVEYIRRIFKLNQKAPPKGIEMSVVLAEHCRNFVHPTPYELHFSCGHLDSIREDPEGYCARMQGVDPDLAAHFTVTRAVGHVLCGAPVGEVFAPVPPRDYLDSIRYDVENAAEDIFENPVYMTLNLCRVLAYMRENAVLSKVQGGEWGLRCLPDKYHGILAGALRAYAADGKFCAEEHREVLTDFAQYMLRRIFGGGQ